jgi:hypothetical protein
MNLLDALMDGEGDVLKVQLQLKAMEDIINTITNTSKKDNKNYQVAELYKKLLLEAAQKHGKEFSYQSAEFKIGEFGTKYDYSQCGDTQIMDLLEQQARINEAVKERKAYLNSITKPTDVLLSKEDGEIATIYPPIKTSTTGVSVSLK